MSASTANRARIVEHFSICKDYRTRPVSYPMIEIIVLVVLATVCGEEGWEGYVEFGEDKLNHLRKFLPFENGIPSPDTVRRVIERINPKEFRKAFVAWATDLKERTSEHICIDGKTLRKSMTEKGPLHIVSAWSKENRLVLECTKTSVSESGKTKKTNEIKAMEELLDLLVLKEGDVITIDAIGCQKAIAAKIRAQKADYILALKGNHPKLLAETENFFTQALEAPEFAPMIAFGSRTLGRGRNDIREVFVTTEIDWLPEKLKNEWVDLRSIAMIVRTWKKGGKEHVQKRYYISSLKNSLEKIGEYTQGHWSIENELHWQLDVTFGEDDSQISPTANENLRVAREISLQMLKKETTYEKGLRAKMRHCLRSEEYFELVLLAGNF